MGAENKQKILVVLGPTASGKTSLALRLAQQYHGEIISADSMQIYRGLNIGTAKATAAERAAVPHHLIDICEPQQLFSVADFVGAANLKIAEIAARGHLPIVAGGTGLYISSLVDGISFSQEGEKAEVREALFLQAEQFGDEAMYNQLAGIDPETAAQVHPNNRKRVLRALEFYQVTGQTLSAQRAASRPASQPYDALLLGLRYDDRAQLYTMINARVDEMLGAGLLNEAKQVFDHRGEWRTAVQAIGYKELFPYLEGQQSLEDCVEKLKQATRNYAKRQMTWFGRMQQIHWLNAASPQPGTYLQQFFADEAER